MHVTCGNLRDDISTLFFIYRITQCRNAKKYYSKDKGGSQPENPAKSQPVNPKKVKAKGKAKAKAKK